MILVLNKSYLLVVVAIKIRFLLNLMLAYYVNPSIYIVS